jgi:hypothetical protein
MHFLFNLLRIKGIYMFRAVLAHPQEVLHKRQLVYWVRVVSWLHQDWSAPQYTKCHCASPPEDKQSSFLVQPTDITRTQYTKCRLLSTSWGWASNAGNMWRPLILNKLNKKCLALVSLYWFFESIIGWEITPLQQKRINDNLRSTAFLAAELWK